MNSKLLSLLMLFIGLPSFIFSGAAPAAVSHGIVAVAPPENELDTLRKINRDKLKYIKYQMTHGESIDSLLEREMEQLK